MVAADTKSSVPPRKLRPRTYVLFSLLAAFLLVISNSALWFNNYIFDGNNFTNITTNAIKKESSRTAIATEIIDRLLEKRPRLKNIIDEPMIKLTSGILDTNLAQTALERVVSRLQILITSKNPQDVTMDLSSIKQTLSRVLTAVDTVSDRNTEEAQVKIEDLPDTITIINTDKFPNIYNLGVALLWIAPLAALGALAALAYIVYRARYSKRLTAQVLAVAGAIIVIAGLFALALGPLFKPPILANVSSANMRVVVENIYQAFIVKLNNQTMTIFLIGILLLTAAAVVLWAKPIAARITRR